MDPVRQSFRVLQAGYAVVSIVAGVDQFLNKLADWSMYLSATATRLMPLSSHHIMMLGGAIEIASGILVAVRPRIGGWVVAVWMWMIMINLLAAASFYDTVLRDFGLSLGAVALARLAVAVDGRTPKAAG
jgi:hypothetical protein